MQTWQNFGFLATNVNATNIPGRAHNNGNQKDINEAIYYNYNKKGYFAI